MGSPEQDQKSEDSDSFHSHSVLLLGVSSLPSISFWPRSQFPLPFLTTQAKLPEEER